MSDSDNDSVALNISDNERPTPIVVPTTNVTIFDLRQALEKAHQQAFHLHEKNRTLWLHTADLTARLIAAKSKKHRKNKTQDAALNHHAIMKLRKSYAVGVSPWVPNNAFLSPLPPDAPAANSKMRVKSKDGYRSGMVIELHDHIKDPGLCHQAQSYPPFRTVVSSFSFCF
ncbi:hypothetical protein V5O48_010911 [Marasmius crinis-equi]|uniref:Uncharacterized protein n=1 Tax=Marasmius crinis-equi TaxID=585013 RepID=A0ABR3F715_9AGAR